MATVGEFLSFMRRESSDRLPDPLLAQQWLELRYGTVLERFPYHFLLREATFNTVAEITAGTVELTLGSATVTETTSNANGWTSAVESRYFRAGGDSEFYLINTFGDANPDTLTLNRVYEGATASGAGYSIFQRFFSLASDVREVLHISRIENASELLKVSQTDLDRGVPNRPTLGEPLWWAPAGRDTSDNLQIELYPPPNEAHGLLYQYIQSIPAVTDADAIILPQVPYGLLRSGWLADYWSWTASREDGPRNAITMSNKFELEFEKRLQEFQIKELPSTASKLIGFGSRAARARKITDDRILPIILPSS